MLVYKSSTTSLILTNLADLLLMRWGAVMFEIYLMQDCGEKDSLDQLVGQSVVKQRNR